MTTYRYKGPVLEEIDDNPGYVQLRHDFVDTTNPQRHLKLTYEQIEQLRDKLARSGAVPPILDQLIEEKKEIEHQPRELTH